MDDIEQKTFILLRPGNQFYDLDDSVLDRLFNDTWVRTEKTTSQFISEFPVCTIDSSFDALKIKGESLIRSVEALLSENESISAEDVAKVNGIIETMRSASNSVDYYNAYDRLLQEYNRLILLP